MTDTCPTCGSPHRQTARSEMEGDGALPLPSHRSAPAHTRAGVLGAFAVGSLAVGAAAIGALAIGRLVIGRARIRHLEIDKLEVGSLKVTDRLETPSDDTRRRRDRSR